MCIAARNEALWTNPYWRTSIGFSSECAGGEEIYSGDLSAQKAERPHANTLIIYRVVRQPNAYCAHVPCPPTCVEKEYPDQISKILKQLYARVTLGDVVPGTLGTVR